MPASETWIVRFSRFVLLAANASTTIRASRLRLINHAFYNLRSFHTGHCRNARDNAADLMHFFPAVGGFAIFLNHMPVDKQIIHHLRPQRIRSDIPVSQAYTRIDCSFSISGISLRSCFASSSETSR